MTGEPMATFEQGDVVRVPFPYTDKATRQHRPALVVSKGAIGENNALLWVAMITSAENRPWSGDEPVANLEKAGLPVASVVRPVKVATIEARHAERLGSLPAAITRRIAVSMAECLGVDLSLKQC